MKKEKRKEWEVNEAENTFLWIKDYMYTIKGLTLLSLVFNLKYIFSRSNFDLIIASISIISSLTIFLSYFLYLAVMFRGGILETDLEISFDYAYKPIFYIFSILFTFILITANL